jgi:hypothetical protein
MPTKIRCLKNSGFLQNDPKPYHLQPQKEIFQPFQVVIDKSLPVFDELKIKPCAEQNIMI